MLRSYIINMCMIRRLWSFIYKRIFLNVVGKCRLRFTRVHTQIKLTYTKKFVTMRESTKKNFPQHIVWRLRDYKYCVSNYTSKKSLEQSGHR